MSADGRTDVRRLLRNAADAFDEAEARGFARGIAAAVAHIEDQARTRGGYVAQVANGLAQSVSAIRPESLKGT